MQDRWNDREAIACGADPLALRVYSSRLLGREPDLVLHGGGNTSVKVEETNIFGDTEEIIYVKGSGWDLATIEAAGFAPVRLDVLRKMARLPALNDTDMVRMQRAAMTDPEAPNPSVEAILHAILPFRFVDHTHADAVVTISNTPDGEDRLRRLFGERVLIVPYVMPGFALARKVYEMSRELDWDGIEGMVLMHHGVFTFADTARESYARMIRLVSMAEAMLSRCGAVVVAGGGKGRMLAEDLDGLARLRRAVAGQRGKAVIARPATDALAHAFSSLPEVRELAGRGPLTPDHVIRIKPVPLICSGDAEADVESFASAYRRYFEHHADGSQRCLDPAPRWAVWPGRGVVAFGTSMKEAEIILDIVSHTIKAMCQAQALGGWSPVPREEIFAVEYWELEQAKLRRQGKEPEFPGRVALVTGAASGIGRACAEALHARGATVLALDIDPKIRETFSGTGIVGRVCDVTDRRAIRTAVREVVRLFGGLDILVSNAGIFPASETLADMRPRTWERSLAVNLSAHQLLLQAAIPFLRHGLDAAVVFIGSKNVPAPGPGAGAYSVAKAGLAQLARVAALELAPAGIRVNTLHPNAVFDTGIWSREVLEKRARQYGMSVEEYKSRTLLGVEVTSRDVAEAVCMLAGRTLAKTTGAQIPVDGGNVRVI